MSTTDVAAAADMMCCASCGQAEVDDVKLMDCNGGCDLAKYCSDDCQENHRSQHGEQCKKRSAELRDKDLFAMPDGSYLGECPICCLPLSVDPSKSTFMGCCSKIICDGCKFANARREDEAGLEQRCAFCREPSPISFEEFRKRVMKRVKKKCPDAMCYMGKMLRREGDYESALEYLTKAVELGDSTGAHYSLSFMYCQGEGVEKDVKKEVYHLEQAAIGGHPDARYNLGVEEWNKNNMERARKHFIIAANLGMHNSLKGLRMLYEEGHASKDDYAGALRAYQAAVDATKSKERDMTAVYKQRIERHSQS